MNKFYNSENIFIAKKLRGTQTKGEIILWSKLRNRQFLGLKFRRQYPALNYILDFFCSEKLLGIEIDGSSHDENHFNYDQQRQQDLENLGIKIVRFSEYDAVHRTTSVLLSIEEALGSTSL